MRCVAFRFVSFLCFALIYAELNRQQNKREKYINKSQSRRRHSLSRLVVIVVAFSFDCCRCCCCCRFASFVVISKAIQFNCSTFNTFTSFSLISYTHTHTQAHTRTHTLARTHIFQLATPFTVHCALHCSKRGARLSRSLVRVLRRFSPAAAAARGGATQRQTERERREPPAATTDTQKHKHELHTNSSLPSAAVSMRDTETVSSRRTRERARERAREILHDVRCFRVLLAYASGVKLRLIAPCRRCHCRWAHSLGSARLGSTRLWARLS